MSDCGGHDFCERDELLARLSAVEAERSEVRQKRAKDKRRIEELSGWYNSAERNIADLKDALRSAEARVEALAEAASDALSWWENHGLFDPDDSTFRATLDALRAVLACPPGPPTDAQILAAALAKNEARRPACPPERGEK